MLKIGGKISLIIGLMLLLFGFNHTALAAGTINGTATYAHDGGAVEGMGIYVYTADNNTYVGSTITDATGAYTITLDAGYYNVYNNTSASNSENQYLIRVNNNITIGDGEIQTVNFSVTRRGNIAGTVYAADGVTPLSGVILVAYHENGYATGYGYATTGSTGVFTLMPMPNSDYTVSSEGEYTIYIHATGYFSGKMENINLTNEISLIGQNISLTPATVYSGIITDSTGVALNQAQVMLTSSSGHTWTDTTDVGGNYSVSVYQTGNYNQSAVGTYTITISKNGYISESRTSVITTDGTTVSGNYSLNQSGTITGTVTNSSGVGIPTATVFANDGYGNTYTTTTASNGVFSLSSLRPSDKYSLTVSKTNYVSQISYNLSVSARIALTDQNFALSAGANYSGSLVDRDNNPIYGAIIYLYNRDKPRTAAFIDGLTAGKYWVHTEYSGYQSSYYSSKAKVTKSAITKNINLEMIQNN